MATPVASMSAPQPPPSQVVPPSLGVGSSVGTSVAVSVGASVNPPEPGETLPTELGDEVASELGTLAVNGDFAPWPCGAEVSALPSHCAASRAPSSPPGWMTLSLGTGSGSKATPAMPPSTPTATGAAGGQPMTVSRMLLEDS